MYVDESGDNGVSGSPYFILSGLLIIMTEWNEFLTEVKKFRKTLRDDYAFLITYELHARELLRGSGFFQKKGLHTPTRVAVYQDALAFLSSQNRYVKLMNVCIDKSKQWNFSETFVERAWRLLIQRFDNFVYEKGTYGIIISDVGYRRLAQRVYRKMRIYNPIPSKKKEMPYYNKPLTLIVEDPNWRYSKESFILQLVDIACDAVKVKVAPSNKAKRKGYSNIWKLLDPIMVKDISKTKDGVVYCP